MNNSPSYSLLGKVEEREWLLLWVIPVAYVLVAYVGVTYARVHGDLSLIWPSTGLALAAVLIFGSRVWPAIAVSALFVALALDAPVGVAVWIMISSTVQVLFVGMLLRVSCKFDGRLQRVRDVLAFLVIGIGLAPLFGAAMGTLAISTFRVAPWDEFARNWRIWWLDEAMGILVVTPVLLVWFHRSGERLSRARALEALALFLLLAVVSHIVSGGALEDRLSKPLSFAFFPFVIWGALRFGQRGAATTTLVAVTVAIVNMVWGEGPFIQSSPTLSLVYLFGFTAATMVAGLLLGAVVSEYRALAKQLQQAGELLEARVTSRTSALEEQLKEGERVSAALRASEERYRRISQAITDYIYTVTFSDGHTIGTSHAPTCEVVTGYSVEELTANPFLWLHMVHSDDRERVLQLTPQILATHRSVTIEHRIVRRDGAVRWVQNTTAPKFDADGTVVSYDGLVKDITERKIAEEALRESEGKFRAIFESAGIGIAITSLEGVFMECNPALTRMLGYGSAELVGQPMKHVTHPSDLSLHKDNVRRVMASREATGCSYDSRYIRKDGSTMWGHLTSALLRDADGYPQYALGLIEDITERKAEELEREKLLRDVQEAMANVKTLTGLVPICSNCKKIRDDRGEWEIVEEYLTLHTGAQFSHGICPDCLRKFYPEYADGFTAAGALHHAPDELHKGGDERGSA